MQFVNLCQIALNSTLASNHADVSWEVVSEQLTDGTCNEVLMGTLNIVHALCEHNGYERMHQINIGDWACSQKATPPFGGNSPDPILAIRICGLGSRERCFAVKRKLEAAYSSQPRNAIAM